MKNPAILNTGRTLILPSFECPNTFSILDWNIRKPPPGRDANLLTHIVDAIDGTSHVASCNDESAIDPWESIVDDMSNIWFPLPMDWKLADFLSHYESINDVRLADGPGDYHRFACRVID